jgi:hypothetical protein
MEKQILASIDRDKAKAAIGLVGFDGSELHVAPHFQGHDAAALQIADQVRCIHADAPAFRFPQRGLKRTTGAPRFGQLRTFSGAYVGYAARRVALISPASPSGAAPDATGVGARHVWISVAKSFSPRVGAIGAEMLLRSITLLPLLPRKVFGVRAQQLAEQAAALHVRGDVETLASGGLR